MKDHNSPRGGPLTWRNAIRGNVFVLGLVSLRADFASEMVNPLLPIFLAYLAGGAQAAFWVGLSEDLAETTGSLLKICSGRISHKAGQRKPLVVLGYGLSAFARPVTALAAAAWQVVRLKFVERIGKVLRTSPRDALIGDSVPKEFRGLAFSFHSIMDHLGAIIGALAAGKFRVTSFRVGRLLKPSRTEWDFVPQVQAKSCSGPYYGQSGRSGTGG